MDRKIPITSIEPFVYDDTVNGVRYFIRPRTGRTDMRFATILETFSSGNTLDKSDAICETVDTFVSGRVSLDRAVPVPDFPKGVRVSDFIDMDTIIDLFNEILVINKLKEAEKKSLLPLQTSSSEQKSTDNSTTVTSASIETKKETAAKSKKRKQ